MNRCVNAFCLTDDKTRLTHRQLPIFTEHELCKGTTQEEAIRRSRHPRDLI